MNDHIDQLSEAFVAHEHLAPNAEDVLARAHRIARSYHRRRWAVRVTGGAVLGAGLVASGIALPRLGQSNSNESLTPVAPAATGDTSPSASPAPYTQAEEMNAYFAAGYDYQDAVQLAADWNDGSDINQVKSDAGLMLLEGDALPVQPSGQPEGKTDLAVNAFFAAGYTYQDAVTLANMWNDTQTYQAKVQGGQMLLDGRALPIPPSGSSQSSSATSTGSTTKLTVVQRKANGLSHARTLTVHAKSASESAVAAFFGAGYGYKDAVALGQLWNISNINRVKADAGKKLLEGQTLPIAP